MKYFFINLEDAVERKEKCENEFHNNNVEGVRVRAVECKPSDFPSSIKNAKENACFRSHIKAMRQFVNTTDDEYAMICEDDITFDFKKYWRCEPDELLKIAPNDTGIIQLCVIYTRIDLNPEWGEQEDFFRWGEIPSVGSCLAYIITRRCAVQLLDYYDSLENLKRIGSTDSKVGIYSNATRFTDTVAYTYKYPMFVYPMENDTQIGNCKNNQQASRRHVEHYLKINFQK
tara:strand:- start:7315 stop:8004 length:690 start_codon:yes stop_codon:yes gene_type:complete